MIKTREAFIRLLADHIHGRTSEWFDHELQKENNEDRIDMSLLLQYGEEQTLLGILYAQLKYLEEVPELLTSGFKSDVYLDVNRKVELDVISSKCPEVPMILMKGSVVKDYYPIPCLRSMGDVDFIIHTEDRSVTDAVMMEEGYSKFVDNHAVWTYSKKDVIFEIHDHMFYEYLSNTIDYRGYFDKVWEHIHKVPGSRNVYVPDQNYHLLYLLTHMAKHIINKGYGFRGFMDLTLMYRSVGEQMDWDWIERELRQLKLYDFACTVFALCRRWFGVEMPFADLELEENFFQTTTAKMFQDGIFGLENEGNDTAHSAKEMNRSDKSYWITTFALTWKHLFPAYEDMQLIPWYSFVDGRPWLMPVAWVYRWFYVLFHKYKTGKEILTEPFMKRKVIEKRQQYINDWGL